MDLNIMLKENVEEMKSVSDHLFIIEGSKEKVKLNILQHTAFTVPSIAEFAAKLSKKKIPYFDGLGKPNNIQTRPDGVKQLIFKDPDGNWVEVNQRP